MLPGVDVLAPYSRNHPVDVGTTASLKASSAVAVSGNGTRSTRGQVPIRVGSRTLNQACSIVLSAVSWRWPCLQPLGAVNGADTDFLEPQLSQLAPYAEALRSEMSDDKYVFLRHPFGEPARRSHGLRA